MIERSVVFSEHNRDVTYTLLRRYFALGRAFLLQSDLQHEFDVMRHERAFDETAIGPLRDFVEHLQEGIFHTPWAYFLLRPGIADIHYIRIHHDHLVPEQVSTVDFLKFKEQQVLRGPNENALEIDFGPFGRYLAKLK